MAGDNDDTNTRSTAPQAQANATNKSILALVSSFALQNSIVGLRPFNGYEWPLKDFIQDVRNGAAGVPENQQTNYLRAVIGKLHGAARDSIYGENITTVDGLIQHLKARFAPGKDYAFYVEQLNNLRMTDGQTIGAFKDRIKILMDSATSALRTEQGDAYNPVMLVPLQSMVLNIFIKGLPPQLSERVDMFHPGNIEDAYTEAIRLESRMEAGIIPDRRYQNHRNNSTYNNQRRSRNNFFQHNNYNNGQNSGHSSNGPFMGQINDYNPQNRNQMYNNQNGYTNQQNQQNMFNPNNYGGRNHRNYNPRQNNEQRSDFQSRRNGNNFNSNRNRNQTYDPDAIPRKPNSYQNNANFNFQNQNRRYNNYNQQNQFQQNPQQGNFNNRQPNNLGQCQYSNNQPNNQHQQNNAQGQAAQCQPIFDNNQHLNQYATCPTAATVGQSQN